MTGFGIFSWGQIGSVGIVSYFRVSVIGNPQYKTSWFGQWHTAKLWRQDAWDLADSDIWKAPSSGKERSVCSTWPELDPFPPHGSMVQDALEALESPPYNILSKLSGIILVLSRSSGAAIFYAGCWEPPTCSTCQYGTEHHGSWRLDQNTTGDLALVPTKFLQEEWWSSRPHLMFGQVAGLLYLGQSACAPFTGSTTISCFATSDRPIYVFSVSQDSCDSSCPKEI
jgi:hypothetical protein